MHGSGKTVNLVSPCQRFRPCASTCRLNPCTSLNHMHVYVQAVEMEAAELEGADEDEGDEVDLVGQRLEHEVRCKKM